MLGISTAITRAGMVPAAGVASDALTAAIMALDPVDLWPLTETSGSVAAATVSAARNGSYSGVLLDQLDGPIAGTRVGTWWSPLGSVCDLYSTSLISAFDGSVGTFLIFVYIPSSGWTDGALSNIVDFRANETEDSVRIIKSATTGLVTIRYEAGNVASLVTHDTSSYAGWALVGCTWDVNAGEDGEMKAYWLESSAGGQVGATQTGLGTWSGPLLEDWMTLGAKGAATPSQIIFGYLGFASIYDKVLSEGEIQGIMAPADPPPPDPE